MLKKSCAIILSIALAMGVLVHGSFAFVHPGSSDLQAFISTYGINNNTFISWHHQLTVSYDTPFDYCVAFQYVNLQNNPDTVKYWMIVCSNVNFTLFDSGSVGSVEPGGIVAICYGNTYDHGFTSWIAIDNSNSAESAQFDLYMPAWALTSFSTQYAIFYNNFYTNILGLSYDPNLDTSYYFDNPPVQELLAYISSSTYGDAKFLVIQVNDIFLSSTWFSVRMTDDLGNKTEIFTYDYIVNSNVSWTTSGEYTLFRIDPFNLDPDRQFTVNSVLYSGSSSWGIKEISGLDLMFNQDVLPSPIPSSSPVPDYSYYDTTYINYNGGSPNVIYTPLSTHLIYGHTDSDPSILYFEDFHQLPSQNVSYLVQPFSFSYIVIPAGARLNGQYYDDFLEDAIYQYDVVFDNLVYHNNPNDFDLFYGSGSWADLTSDLAVALQNGQLDVSSVLDSWYSSHDPLLLQSPFYSNGEVVLVDYTGECSMILTDSFFFKQTNYLIGDTSDILTELSERFFKVDGFSDSLFQNLSSMYNLNLQYYDSSLQALTGLSYWLNDNDISSGLSDIANLLSSVDNYLSSVDGKLNYLSIIDSDLIDLLEWFQNQEDSDVTLTLPDFNPSILIEYYGDNMGDFVEFVQDFVNTLPSFDYSDFPNFFDYASDLVDDTAGQGDDLIGSLFQPYDYDDSGLHEFGWD